MNKWHKFEIPEPGGGAVQEIEHPNPEGPGVIIHIHGAPPKNIKPEHLEQISKRTEQLKADMDANKIR